MTILKFASRKGSVFTMLMGTVAMVGVVGVAAMNMIGGPITTAAKVTHQNMAQNDLLMNAKVIVMNASVRPDQGDEDGDGYVEPVPFIPTSASSCNITLPAGSSGGCLPGDIGAILTDPWGTSYMYCVWDHGETTTSTNRIAGEDSTSGAVLAVISAGPNKRFETPCLAYDGDPGTNDDAINPDGLGDDLVQIYTYAAAVAGSGGLWELKQNEPETAIINKKLEIGDITSGTGFAFDTETGQGEFPYIKTDFIASKTGGNTPVTMVNNIALDGNWLSGSGNDRGLFIENNGHIKIGSGNNPAFSRLDLNAYPTRTHGVDPLTSVSSDFAILLGCKVSGAGPTASCSTGRAVGFALARQNSSQPNAMLEYRAGAHSFHNFANNNPMLRLDDQYLYQNSAAVIRSGSSAVDKGILSLQNSAGSDVMTVNNSGNVGIGSTTPIYKLTVTDNGANARAVYGHATSPTGQTFGGSFQSDSTAGTAVYGYAAAESGQSYGVFALSASTAGRGVFGRATASTGTTYGGDFSSLSSGGYGVRGNGGLYGVFGEAINSTGINRGGYFRTNSPNGRGVEGIATAASGNAAGVYAMTYATEGDAIYGVAVATSGKTFAIRGQVNSPDGYALRGNATNGGFGLYSDGKAHVQGNLSVSGLMDVTNNRILRVATPTETTDAANKAYVDSMGGKNCTSGQLLKWNGTTWACAGDAIGSGGDNLGNHTATANLIPSATNIHDLGSILNRWKSGYFGNLSSSTMDLSRNAPGTNEFSDAYTLTVANSVAVGRGTAIRAYTSSPSGYGIMASGANSGNNGAAYFDSISPNATVVNVQARSSSGNTYGMTVYASQSPNGTGIMTSGGLYGLDGRTSSGRGVRGWASGSSGTNYGVFGQTNSPDGYGVYSHGRMHSTGALTVGGAVTATAFLYSSDERLKADIKPLGLSMDDLDGITAYRYHYMADDDETPRIGVIAQEVQAVFPEAVKTGEDGMMSVDYPALVPVLLDAVKQLKAENDAIRRQMKADNDNLRMEIRALTKAAR